MKGIISTQKWMAALLALLLTSSISHATNPKQTQTINVLTWWGYLDNKVIVNNIEKKCGVKISFDQYYSNSEFLRRYRETAHAYDVIIFSNAIYEGIRAEVPNINSSNLYRQSDRYLPAIKKHYLEGKYPKNIVYFAHSLAGFLYNPQAIKFSSGETLQEILQKSSKKIVVMMDDAVEINKLLSFDGGSGKVGEVGETNFLQDSKIFKQLQLKTTLYIGNGFKKIYDDNNFAFAYIWSGEAIRRIKETNSRLKYFVHPKISYLSSDMLAENNNKIDTHCVAAYLTSESVMKVVQNDNYYFTPYSVIREDQDANLRVVYEDFLRLLPQLKWIDSIGPDDFENFNKAWDLIKLDILTKNEDA